MDYLSGWCTSTARLEGKTAIVTGANCGIGKETALDFYQRGARVIMACRKESSALEAKEDIERKAAPSAPTGKLLIMGLDLASLASVRRFCEDVTRRESNVHILVNNAGVMACPRGETEDGFEMQMGTNHLGHALLTLLLLPVMAKSAPSRIVCLSSVLHHNYPVDVEDLNFEKKPYNALEAYGRSKSANILFAKELANKLKEHKIEGVTTYSVHPGVVHTELGRHFSATLYRGATLLWHVFACFLKSPRCGAQTTVHCAVDERAASETGLYYSNCAVLESSKQTRCSLAATRLWDETVRLLQVDDTQLFVNISNSDAPVNEKSIQEQTKT